MYHKQVPWLDVLPHWVLIEVFFFLDIASLISSSQVLHLFQTFILSLTLIRQVCKAHNKLGNDPRVWKFLLKQLPTPPNLVPGIHPKIQYRDARLAKRKGKAKLTVSHSGLQLFGPNAK